MARTSQHIALHPDALAPAQELTPKQRRFVEHYVANGGEPRPAAIAAGYTPKSASPTASKLLRDPKVQREIAALMMQSFGLAAVPALATVRRLSTSARSEYVQLEASRDILDRAGFKPPERMEATLDADLHVSFDVMPSAKTIEGEGG